MRSRLVAPLALLLVVVGASAAGADQATPSSYESIILDVTSDRIDARIVGGDAFLELTVAPGTEVVVPGYTIDDPEPYLRFLPDGTVERNRNSPATYLNDDRFARVTVPDTASPEAEPDWEQVASSGTYTWHDHRIHWMGLDPPASVRAANERILIQEWSVPVTVTGEGMATITGELAWLPDRAPTIPLVVGAAAAAALVALWWFRARLLAVVPLLVGLSAVFAGWQVARIQPPEAGRFGPDLVLPVAAVVLAVAGMILAARRPWPGLVGAVAAGAALGAWAATRLDALLRPVLPTATPGLDRLATALAAGTAVGTVLILVAVSAAPSLTRGDSSRAATVATAPGPGSDDPPV